MSVQRLARPASALAIALALVPSIAAVAAPPAKPDKSAGIAVKVTPEMIGAGIVSSGAVLPAIPPVTGNRARPVPSWGKPLPYPIIIADRRNNRLIEIAPDKRIVWEFPSPSLAIYRGNEDVNFSEDGKLLAVSEEDNYDLHIVDYEQKVVTWTFGIPDHRGSTGSLMNYPDDSHLLADGKFISADIRNCRVLFIDTKENRIDSQWGKTGDCRHDPPRALAWPNGVTPTADGDIIVTEISGSWVSRITREGKVKWSVQAPNVRYPSDTFPTVDGKQMITADFSKPGKVVIFDPATKKATWEYFVKEGEGMLDHPSIARELPDTLDVLIVDDLHDRVIVVDRQTKKIIWQYGEKGVKGYKPGLLNYPDGVDIDVFRDWKAALKTSAPAASK